MDIQNGLNGIAEQPLTTAPFQQTADPVCPGCGKVNLADGGFCRFCGSPLSAPQPAPAPTPAPASPFSQGAMGSAYQQNTMQGSTYQQNTMQGSAYQPQYQGYNYNQSPMGMGGFYNPNPEFKESKDIYGGYYTYSYYGVTYWNHDSYEEKKVK